MWKLRVVLYFLREKKSCTYSVIFPGYSYIYFLFIHNENLLNCHFLANNLRLSKAKDTLTNDELLALGKSLSIDHISQIINKKQNRLARRFPGHF